jgi:hypothetical protein
MVEEDEDKGCLLGQEEEGERIIEMWVCIYTFYNFKAVNSTLDKPTIEELWDLLLKHGYLNQEFDLLTKGF